VLRAAAEATRLGIATCLFLEDRMTLCAAGAEHGVDVTEGMRSFDLEQRLEAYVQDLTALRRRKGMTEERARTMLGDRQIAATMMVASRDADGLVSGAATVTADVLRPALQLIGKVEEEPLVSSFFFMCFDDGPKLFADCALNTAPNASDLAGIALQSARTARAFGLLPRIAMLSYSTGRSGSGPAVDLVRAAADSVRQAEPDLLIEGPIQYDAAVDPRVARTKLPESEVAGRATVLIFPDLDAGNITYKAVQQAGKIISVGPIIQGLKRPINDVSRGSTTEDILYTIATTVIQAQGLSAASL
jgi:phosphate acetyltransferase